MITTGVYVTLHPLNGLSEVFSCQCNVTSVDAFRLNSYKQHCFIFLKLFIILEGI